MQLLLTDTTCNASPDGGSVTAGQLVCAAEPRSGLYLNQADDWAKDVNGGCTKEESDQYRNTVAKSLCTQTKEGQKIMSKANEYTGYVTGAGAIAGGVAGYAGASGAAAAIAEVAGPLGIIAAIAGFYELRLKSDTKHYCSEALGGHIEHCECSNGSECDGDIL